MEPIPLLERVTAAATCSSCGQRRITHEVLAQQTGLSLRTVVRFLQGDPMAPATAAKLERWLSPIRSDT